MQKSIRFATKLILWKSFKHNTSYKQFYQNKHTSLQKLAQAYLPVNQTPSNMAEALTQVKQGITAHACTVVSTRENVLHDKYREIWIWKLAVERRNIFEREESSAKYVLLLLFFLIIRTFSRIYFYSVR